MFQGEGRIVKFTLSFLIALFLNYFMREEEASILISHAIPSSFRYPHSKSYFNNKICTGSLQSVIRNYSITFGCQTYICILSCTGE